MTVLINFGGNEMFLPGFFYFHNSNALPPMNFICTSCIYFVIGTPSYQSHPAASRIAWGVSQTYFRSRLHQTCAYHFMIFMLLCTCLYSTGFSKSPTFHSCIIRFLGASQNGPYRMSESTCLLHFFMLTIEAFQKILNQCGDHQCTAYQQKWSPYQQ